MWCGNSLANHPSSNPWKQQSFAFSCTLTFLRYLLEPRSMWNPGSSSSLDAPQQWVVLNDAESIANVKTSVSLWIIKMQMMGIVVMPLMPCIHSMFLIYHGDLHLQDVLIFAGWMMLNTWMAKIKSESRTCCWSPWEIEMARMWFFQPVSSHNWNIGVGRTADSMDIGIGNLKNLCIPQGKCSKYICW